MRWILLTALAPIAWGSVYYVTRHVLPIDAPLWGGVFRALPAGVVLLVLVRRVPTGSWWWKSLLLGVLNVGGFFALVYVAATRLPSSLASTLMSASAAAMLLLGWAVLRQRPRMTAVAGAITGIVGVIVMVGGGANDVDPVGVAASLGAMTASAVGFVLTARWGSGVPAVALASWQLLAGGLVLVPVAFIIEGAPTVPSGAQLAGFAYVSLIATALAYTVWFQGLARLRASTVGAIGLLNPVTGILLGVVLGGEPFGAPHVVGAVLVVTGVVLGALPARRDVQRSVGEVVTTRSAATN